MIKNNVNFNDRHLNNRFLELQSYYKNDEDAFKQILKNKSWLGA